MSKHKRLIEAGTHLTVLIRDDSPIRQAESSPQFRRVTIGLTSDQISALMLEQTDSIGNTPFYEEIDRIFLETDKEV